MSTFIDRFSEATDEHGIREKWSPASYIEAWQFFVTECEEGYQSSIYEYENELSVRDVIERALSIPGLAEDSEGVLFADAIAKVDSRFASLLASGPEIAGEAVPWWRRRIPSHAGEELVADVEAQYSVRIESSDGLA